MEFHDYPTLYAATARALKGAGRKPPSMQEFYEQTMERRPADLATKLQAATEMEWQLDRRPYYSVYPIAVQSLLKLKLDIDSSLIKLPLPALLVRFPIGHEIDALGDRRYLARSILVSTVAFENGGSGFPLWIDFGETHPNGFPVVSYRTFGLGNGMSVEEELKHPDEIKDPRADPAEVFVPYIRLVCSLCLLADDTSIIEPDVLTADRAAYRDTRDPKFVERARRRGKVGWLIGAHLDVAPHYRRPHFALRWTGRGGTIPQIVAVRGAVVKRRTLSEVPTGYMDDDSDSVASDSDLPPAT